MSPLPWPLIGRTAAEDAPPARALPHRSLTTNYEITHHVWGPLEAAVLARLAEHGGDLAAHRTVHLEGK